VRQAIAASERLRKSPLSQVDTELLDQIERLREDLLRHTAPQMPSDLRDQVIQAVKEAMGQQSVRRASARLE
jgi:hypothetical protein